MGVSWVNFFKAAFWMGICFSDNWTIVQSYA